MSRVAAATRGRPQPEERMEGDDAARTEDANRKKEEKERKKAEVRKRLEESAKAKKGVKKGFLTPERKKKLRQLLMKKAAEDMKKEQEKKAGERKRILEQRVGQPKHSNASDQNALQNICKEYNDRIKSLESERYDLEVRVRQKDYEINELTIQVNDLRGKFVKPTLKKISKYDSKFQKMAEAKKAAEVDFRSNLKSTGINKFALKEESGEKKPDWAAQRVTGEGGAEE